MVSTRLTKSAFKVGRSCPTKLYYYKAEYPSTLSDNAYLNFLADGGHIVGKLAQILHPDGILIGGKDDLDAAVAQTEAELKKENVTLFEAAIRHDNKLVRVDLLQKRGKSVRLIEVKSKSYDSDEEHAYRSEGKRTTFMTGKGTPDREWRPYLEDICYQGYVLSLAHPELEWTPYLFLPDKAKTTKVEGLAAMFRVLETKDPRSRKRYLDVEFNGDAAALRADDFMTLVNVEDEVKLLWDEVRDAAETLDRSLTPQLKKIVTEPSSVCSGCEYRVKGTGKSGFRECWGARGDADPHLFDLYFGTMIKGGDLFDSLIPQGKTSLLDVPTALLSGKRGDRQLIQINHTRSNTEWFSDELSSIIQGVKYPLYFIDFETSRVAVPYHAKMRPYEQVAFQWSCHTVAAPGAQPVHSDWINTQEMFPNFEFARSLRKQIGNSGSVLTWAHHESSVLKDIVGQARRYRKEDPELADWVAGLINDDHGRILDLNKVTLKNYFHPAMRGKTSLKAVLPAVWNNHPELHEIPWLKKYVSYEADGRRVLDPYKTLSKIEIAGQAEIVQEGTGAMRAYQHMMYGKGREADAEVREGWRRLLLQYCELDTIAMLVVWTYWERALGLRAKGPSSRKREEVSPAGW
jgi:hypothetical protein